MIPDDFNCIRMKRSGAEAVLKQTEGMTLDQRIAYWVKKNQEFLKWHEELRKGRQGPNQSQ